MLWSPGIKKISKLNDFDCITFPCEIEISISLHERAVFGEKCSHFNDHRVLFYLNLFKSLINMIFKIALHEYFM